VRTLVLAGMLSPADFALMRMGAIAMATLEALSRTGFDRALIQRKRSVDGTEAEYKDLTLRGDMRDIQVSFAKIRQALGYEPKSSVEESISEVQDVIVSGLITGPLNSSYRNAHFIVQ